MTNPKKKLRKRWGKKFIDKRNWSVYNKQLVKRGEYLLALDFVEGWNDELAAMNAGKRGAPYQFPKSLIELQSVWHAHSLPYRMIEGLTIKLCELGQLPDSNNYSTVDRRVNQLGFELAPPRGDAIVLFSDGSGLQAVSGGEYLREKYGKKNRCWVQVIILGDPVTKEPVSFEVNLVHESEPESTERQLVPLLKQGVPITAIGGDGGLDDKGLYNFCDDQELDPIIKPDKNARDDTDCDLRNQVVKERDKLGYKKWAKKHRYGDRWPATEGIFSAVKRIFGEEVRATSDQGMLQEAACKVWAYQKLKRYGEA